MNNEISNGVIIDLKPTDWRVGGETGITFEYVTDNWEPSLPDYENQSTSMFDSSGCVTFSGTNCLEMMIRQMIQSNKLSLITLEALRPYKDSNGQINFNDCFTARMSNTTKVGNTFQNVWDSIRKDGLLPQGDWKKPEDCKTWEEWSEEPPQELKDKAKKILDIFDFSYEWVCFGNTSEERMNQALLQSPLHIATTCCPGWEKDTPVKTCSGPIHHATTLYGNKGTRKIYDHYLPAKKELDSSYPIPWALKPVITVKKEVVNPKPKYTFNRDMAFMERNGDVTQLQKALKYLGLLKVEPTGYYGENTRNAVYLFQTKYKVADIATLNVLQGKRVGPATRKKLNELFS